MRVSYFPKQISKDPTTVVLGSFDFIHNGHLKLLEKAKEFNQPICFVIMEDIKEHKVGPDAHHVSYLEERLLQLAQLGVDMVSVIKFNDKFKEIEGSKFIDDVLEVTSATNIVVGSDYKYGKGAKCNFKGVDKVKDSNVHVVDLLKINDKKISTSLIRTAVSNGEFNFVNSIAPFSYKIKVEVTDKKISNWNNFIIPIEGIYACFIYIDNVRYYGYVRHDKEEKWLIYINGVSRTIEPKIVELEFIEKVDEGHSEVQDMNIIIEEVKKILVKHIT